MTEDETSRVRAFYEDHIAAAGENEVELYNTFHPAGNEGLLNAENEWDAMPLGVLEAYAYYKLYVMDQDWGSVGAYRVAAGEAETIAVWVRDDGGRCWLEVYEAGGDGAFVASARSANGKVAWRSRDEIRKNVFSGDILPVELLTPEEIAFWKTHERL